MEHVKHRRKPVECVLCKKETTYDWNAICDTCKSDWRYGRDMKAQRSSELVASSNALVEVGITHRWYVSPTGFDTGYPPREPALDLHEASEKLREHFIGVMLAAGGVLRPPKSGDGPEYLFSVHTYLRPHESHSENYGGIWLLGHKMAEALERLLEHTQAYGASCYWDGRVAGTDFLRRVASGDLSVDEINKWHDRNLRRTPGTH